MGNGNFAGGFARGFRGGFQMVSDIRERREDRDLRRQQLVQAQQEAARRLAQDRIKARNTEFQNLGVRLGSDPTFAAGLTSNRLEDLPPGIQEMLQPHIQGQVRDILLANPGLDPEAAQQQVMLTVMNSFGLPAAQMRQKVEEAAQTTAAREAEQIQALSPGQQLITGRGEAVTGQLPELPDTGPFQNFVNPQTGEMRPARRDSPEATQLANQGFVPIRIGVEAPSLAEAGLPLTRSQRGRTAQEASQAAGVAAQISSVLQDIREAGPGVVGFRAIAGKTLGGFVAQLSGSAGEEVTKAITGVSQEELGDIRAAARSAASALIRPLLQEQGARLSDQERQIADETTGIIEDAEASLPLVQGALKRALQLQYLVADRLALEAGQQGIELQTDEQVNAFGQSLEEQGLPIEFIDELIDELLRQRKVLGLVQG